MPLSDKISHLSSDEHRNKQHPNETNQSLITAGLVVNTTYVKYKLNSNHASEEIAS